MKMTPSWLGRVALVAPLLGLTHPVLASVPATSYAVQDLGILGTGDYGTRALGINASGTVVGFSAGSPCTLNGFLWNGSLQHIPDGGACSATYAINRSGAAAVSVMGSGGCYHAFRLTGGNMVALQALSGALPCSDAYAINDSGQIAGRASLSTIDRPVLWDATNNQITDLGTLGGTRGWALGVNSGGQVVGTSATPQTTYTYWDTGHAFLWDGGTIHDLNDPSFNHTPDWELTKAAAINDAGQIVGDGWRQGRSIIRAFLYSITNHATTDLGTFPNGGISYALGLNRHGDVVGAAYLDPTGAGNYRAFVYTNGGGMANLNALIPAASGWVLREATGVNDRGRISGWGSHNGDARAFRLVPRPSIAVQGTVYNPPPQFTPVALLVTQGAYFTPSRTVRVRVNGVVVGSKVTDGDGQFSFTKRNVECDTELEVVAEDVDTGETSAPATVTIVCE